MIAQTESKWPLILSNVDNGGEMQEKLTKFMLCDTKLIGNTLREKDSHSKWLAAWSNSCEWGNKMILLTFEQNRKTEETFPKYFQVELEELRPPKISCKFESP